ncbi:MAG: hypothetical protein HYU69_08460 [Bacteroidetes bacterium]|nr:hypothetical protein [Bacteroidota bacterium]
MESKKFIYILKLLPKYTREVNWTEETRNIITSHFNYLQKLKEEEQLILAGRTDYSVEDPLTFGIAIFTAKDMDAAKELMNNDPAIKMGVMNGELHPFSHAL